MGHKAASDAQLGPQNPAALLTPSLPTLFTVVSTKKMSLGKKQTAGNQARVRVVEATARARNLYINVRAN